MKTFLCLLASLLVLACGSENRESESQTTTDQVATRVTTRVTVPDAVVELAKRNVSCGCALEEIGHCGNYIQIDAQYVGIANGTDFGLGGMEWCGKSGMQAESAGEIKDGTFVATTLAVIPVAENP